MIGGVGIFEGMDYVLDGSFKVESTHHLVKGRRISLAAEAHPFRTCRAAANSADGLRYRPDLTGASGTYPESNVRLIATADKASGREEVE
jgi:hypothetical protein